MLNSLLKRLQIILMTTFLLGTLIFYFMLEAFHEEEAHQLIKENVLMFKAMQQYLSEYQKPAIYKLINDKDLSKDYFDPAILSSTYIISEVHKIFKKNHLKSDIDSHEEVELRFASDNPTNPINKATPFELEVLKKFNESDISSYKQSIIHNGKETLFFALPVLKNTQACLRCHGDPKDAPKDMLEVYGDKNGFNEKVGHIRAIDAVYSTIDSNNDMMKFFLLIEGMMLIVFIGIFFSVRFFLIQLNEKDRFIAKQSKFAAMGEMIGMIAHQWRQPLTGMSITTNNLLLDVELQDIDEKRFKDNLETVNKQIEYLSHTIDDFKNFFKPNIKSEVVDINKLIDDSCTIIDTTFKSNGIEIEKNYIDGVTAVITKNDLMQIILNLLKNSMDAYVENKMEDRIINISTNQTSQKAFIRVKDNAGGIPKEIIEKIFDPYFSTKDKKNGTGLGLYMSKMIIESHLNGQLLVETIDSSTTFTIILPKRKDK